MPSSKILVAVLGVWSFGSTAFIAYDRWRHFAAEELARAADQGRREILGQIIREAAKCRPFSAANGEQTAELIGTSCLSQGASPERGAPPVQAPPMRGPPLAESAQPR
jgi:hypothetical protein